MRAPLRQGGSTDFFGIAFALARWHEDDDRIVIRPLQDQVVEEVIAIAPRYGDPYALTATSPEVENIPVIIVGTRGGWAVSRVQIACSKPAKRYRAFCRTR
jgi:hypothetical protein